MNKNKLIISFLLITFNCKAQYYFEPIGNGQGITANTNSGPRTLCSDSANHLLYVLGNYQKADGVTYNGTCVWNGNNYDSLLNFGAVPSAWVRSAKWGDTTVIIWDNNVRLMNGTQFLQFLPSMQSSFGVSGIIFSVCELNHELYIGGDFKIAGTTTVNNIAKWNGTDWESLGGGISGSIPNTPIIRCLGINNGDLIASGWFDSIGGEGAKNIARWDGVQWHDMGGADLTSTSGTYIKAMKQFNADLYITGGFGEVGGVTCLGFAKWNGTNWSVPQNSENITVDGTDLEVYNNKLFISGWTYNIPDHGALSSYDGDTFKIIYNNSIAHIYTMEVFDSFLYVGGSFDTLRDVACNRIARFFEDKETGLHEVPFENENEMLVFPNPANESVTVKLSSAANEIELTDLLGRVVLNQTVTPTERSKELNLSNLNSGIYFLTIQTVTGNKTVKVVKE